MELFKRITFWLLVAHGVVDLILAVLLYLQMQMIVPALFPVTMGVVFSFYLFPALKNEEFSRRWFPGKGFGRGPINDPIAVAITFSLLQLIHLVLTGLFIRVVLWYPN